MGRPKKQKELTPEQIKEKEDRKALISYLEKIWDGKINYAMINSQLKKMREDNPSMTYGGIQYTLWYAINHQNMKITSLMIVPFLYDEAKNYCKWLKHIKKQVKEWEKDEKEIDIYMSRDRKEDIFT